MAKESAFWWRLLKPELLWYLVGLIASDGCLSSDGRHIDITAKDEAYLLALKKACGISIKVGSKTNGRGQVSYRLQLGSKSFYQFLLEIGLTPNKSKILGSLVVPDSFFGDFLRGVIDGDGCIRKWIHPTNGCTQWYLKVSTASATFAKWLHYNIKEHMCVSGTVICDSSRMCNVKFGKLAAQKICQYCYLNGQGFCLPRKAKLAKQCVQQENSWKKTKCVYTL